MSQETANHVGERLQAMVAESVGEKVRRSAMHRNQVPQSETACRTYHADVMKTGSFEGLVSPTLPVEMSALGQSEVRPQDTCSPSRRSLCQVEPGEALGSVTERQSFMQYSQRPSVFLQFKSTNQ